MRCMRCGESIATIEEAKVHKRVPGQISQAHFTRLVALFFEIIPNSLDTQINS